MNERKLVGLNPWLPWPLCDWPWWTEPVRAERLAALRIGFAAVLLFDVLALYLPHAGDFFGTGSLGSPEVFAEASRPWSHWSALRGIGDRHLLFGALFIWAVAGAFLLVGLLPRASAAVAWVMSVSVMGINFYIHNSGDNVRSITLFYLMLCPCGAVWSLQNWKAWHEELRPQTVYVPAWPVRLLFIQLMVSYFFNGLYKISGPDWRHGDIMHYVMGNLGWTRFSYAQLWLPSPVLYLLTWGTLIFELGFPLLVLQPRTRTLALWTGVSFHVGTEVFLQLGPFPLYMLCWYLPLVPWERYVDWWQERRALATSRRSMF